MADSQFRKSILDNGMIVLSERVDSVRSVAVGVWVKTGSRNESAENNGIAHFLEHMMFKGTRKRSPLKIAQSLESLGGNLNAFTGKEVTCYFANSLDHHLRNAVEVLADMTCNSVFSEKEISKERLVVLEEINAVKDTPEEFIFDVFHERMFRDTALGRPILGSEQNVKNFQRSQVVDFWQSHYAANNIVIAAAGNLEHETLVRYVEKYFNYETILSDTYAELPRVSEPQIHQIHQPINQAHICLGIESIPYNSDQRFALLVLNTYLGGGMSSRLFQQLREKHGLAYNVYSFSDFFKDIGIFGVYIGTDPKRTEKALELLDKELERLRSTPLKNGTLMKIKNQLKGNLVLGLESTSRQMSRLAKNEIYFNEYITIDSLLQSIDAVTQDEILSLAQEIIKPQQFTTVILRNQN